MAINEKSLAEVELLLEKMAGAGNYPLSADSTNYFDESAIMALANEEADQRYRRKLINNSDETKYFYRWIKLKGNYSKHLIWQALEARGWKISFSEFIDQIENKTIDPELRKAIDAIVEEEIHE